MSAVRLDTKSVEKPWGRTDLPAIFPHAEGKKIGEIWFDGPEGEHPPLLVKYIFTSEKLSIQVHPTDAQAKARGLPGGKSECWYVLNAESDARLGIGTTRPLDADELRAAALDGSIEQLMDWKQVQPGSFYYIPAGTVHAIGGGITLIEVQQNNDVTYRLYDYGRPRELHLDDGVSVSVAEPFKDSETVLSSNEETLVDGAGKPFKLDMVTVESGHHIIKGLMAWFVPLVGEGLIDGAPWRQGECWLITGKADISLMKQATYLIARV